MRKYEYMPVMQKEVTEWKCDVCGLDFISNSLEAEEAIDIHKFGGYASIFGDGTEFYIDMCQHCFKNILGKYVNIVIED
jgi:hypothetical protein